MKLSGWGQFPRKECKIYRPRTPEAVAQQIARGPLIARGNGRAYGDSALNPASTLDMRGFDRMSAFNDISGQLVAEAGVLLSDIITSFMPRGWFPAVTPGTKFVTVGGMIAADVHGKNHHKDGSFSQFIDWIDVMGSDGLVTRCGPDQNADLFNWTVGGMGLTGVILRAAFRLRPVQSGWIEQTTVPAANLDAAIEIFETHQHATYSVAWIDCLASGDALGRSLVMLGEHTPRQALPTKLKRKPFETPRKGIRRVPFNAPGFALNPYTVRAFNALYYYKGSRKAGVHLVDWDSYFYPLDGILDWNRIYGSNGFAQFQCALPLATSQAGLTALLTRLSAAGQGSFLAVLKRFGPQDSRFSFPMEGYTLALDFPVRPKTLSLLSELDEITLAHGGRFYLAKDSRMTSDTMRRSDDRLQSFLDMRDETGVSTQFNSIQSERLKI